MTIETVPLSVPFSYHLPFEKIAQRPIHPPEAAKLLVSSPAIPCAAATFRNLDNWLQKGDLLVFNQTKVDPVRLRGSLTGNRDAAVELLLTSRTPEGYWRCMAKPLRKLEQGTVIRIGEYLQATVQLRTGEKEIVVSFTSSSNDHTIAQLLDQVGEMPIPPYIRKGRADAQDRKDYQSVFAQHPGSVAAPTASLHFSQELVSRLDQQGIERQGVILHLGTASFLPIADPDVPGMLRPPGVEHYIHSNALLEKIAATRSNGGKVVAVGTSVVRALESMARYSAIEGALIQSDLFIRPGFEFLALDAIVTNFHQPGTSHLLLVEAFIGSSRLAYLYDYALNNEFRFLSYGDGMLLYPENAT